MPTRKVSKLQVKTLDALVEEYNGTLNALGYGGSILHYEEGDADVVATADATDSATNIVLINALRVAYVAHIASTKKHTVADATNTVTAPTATNDATSYTLANELKVDINAHQLLITGDVHRGSGGQGATTAAPIAIATTDASTVGTATTLANAIKAAYNHHLRSGAQNLTASGT